MTCEIIQKIWDLGRRTKCNANKILKPKAIPIKSRTSSPPVTYIAVLNWKVTQFICNTYKIKIFKLVKRALTDVYFFFARKHFFLKHKICWLPKFCGLNFSDFACIIRTAHTNKLGTHLLCILTSKRVIRGPFAGRNQFFDAKTTFWVLLGHKMYKIT